MRNYKIIEGLLLTSICIILLTACEKKSENISQTEESEVYKSTYITQENDNKNQIVNQKVYENFKGTWSREGKQKEEILHNGGSYLEVYEINNNFLKGSYISIQEQSLRIAQIDIAAEINDYCISESFSDDGFGNRGIMQIKMATEEVRVEILFEHKGEGNWSIQDSDLVPMNEIRKYDEEELVLYTSAINDYREKMGKFDVDYDNFIFDTDERVYSMEEIKELTEIQRSIFRNEIYARHGYVFELEVLNQLFKEYSWYVPMKSQNFFDTNDFSEYEQENLNNIVQY
ncbi:YARHG domain-containing protein [Tissierella carlieri]|uniref:YARHG domain-containing protein n=1 Tax=Tissierella carlieri TaxID=689904 RepID=A0ABT1SA85_9FIRM|nr:YARHG domain-containing protein [Tissierella carlieri]MCQ4922922.1 YARHG domain-containing protein [Tissierella carlieri]